MRRAFAAIIIVFSFLACYHITYAAGADANSPTVSPGRLDAQTTKQVQELQKKPDELNLKDEVSKEKAPKPAAAHEAKLVVKRITLSGFHKTVPASVYQEAAKLVGKRYTLSDLRVIAIKLQNAFRAAGYILVQVILPPQHVKAGSVRFEVIPGFIARVDIRGNAQSATAQLKRYLADIQADKPLQLGVLEHYLLLANRIPGLTVKTVLTPDTKVKGGALLIVNIKGERFNGFVNYNNRLSHFFGEEQGLLGVTMNRLFGADSLSLAGSLSFPNTEHLIYRAATYNIQLGAWGTNFQLQATDTRTKPGGSLASSNIRGQSEYRSFQITQPVIVSRRDNLDFTGSIYHLTSSNVFTDTDTESFDDKITALTLGSGFNFYAWRSFNNLSLQLTRGIAWDSDENNPSRIGAQRIFTKLEGNLSHTQFLSSRWQVVLQGSFQYTNEPLVASEQFGYGGTPFGLAYDYSEITGDSGMDGKVQLNYTLTDPLPYFDTIQPFLYYDIGKVYNSTSSAAQHSQSAASAGGGINLVIAKDIQGSFVIAKPLTFTPAIPANRHPRFFFNLTMLF